MEWHRSYFFWHFVMWRVVRISIKLKNIWPRISSQSYNNIASSSQRCKHDWEDWVLLTVIGCHRQCLLLIGQCCAEIQNFISDADQNWLHWIITIISPRVWSIRNNKLGVKSEIWSIHEAEEMGGGDGDQLIMAWHGECQEPSHLTSGSASEKWEKGVNWLASGH